MEIAGVMRPFWIDSARRDNTLDNESGEDLVSDGLGLDLSTSLRDIGTRVLHQFIPPAGIIPKIEPEGLRLTASHAELSTRLRLLYRRLAHTTANNRPFIERNSTKQTARYTRPTYQCVSLTERKRFFPKLRMRRKAVHVHGYAPYLGPNRSPRYVASNMHYKDRGEHAHARGTIWQTTFIGSGLRLHPVFWPYQISDLPHSYRSLAIGRLMHRDSVL
jgi:hypothetical protein